MTEIKKTTISASSSSRDRKRRKAVFVGLYAILGICFMAAWAAPLRSMVSHRLWPRPEAATRDAYGFIALAYTCAEDGVGGHNTLIPEHVDALIANGYVPITLNDAAQLVLRGTPVPRKAVLLTVDATCQQILHNARTAVHRYGWHGVAFFSSPADGTLLGNPKVWKAARALGKNSSWDIGRLGLPELATADENLKGRTQPLVLAYPAGDFGQFTPTDDNRQTDVRAAAARYSLAFTRGTTGRNTMFSDRLRLNRMTINSAWSGSELIAAIKSANREIESVEDTDRTRKATGWIADRGRLTVSDNGLEIRTENNSGDARVWLAGSDVRRDFNASLDFKIEEGTAAFYMRTAADHSSYLMVEFGSDGAAVLQQKSVLNDSPIILAETRSPVRKDRTHHLSIFMRESNINVTIDGLPVFNTHEQTAGIKPTGMIGVCVKADVPEKDAALTIDHVVLRARRSTMVSWDFEENFEPYVIQWIQTHGRRLTEISPPLDRLLINGPSRNSESRTLYRHLARMYNLRLIPAIHISSAKDFEAWPPVSLAGVVGDIDCDGLYVNFEKYSNLEVHDLDRWLRQTGRLLSGAGRPVLVRLPRMFERLSAVYSLLALIPSVEIVADANAIVPNYSVQTKLIVEENITTPTLAAMTALPPVFTLQESPVADLKKTLEKQIGEWIDTGEVAFRRGTYEAAIAAFSEWHRLAPSTPVPLRRIGDALANLGYADEAIGFYRQSLDLDPAQMSLAARLAQLLMETGRNTEARNLLNSFSRLFPNSADVLLAQAEWLYRNNRTEEAAARVERILQVEPNHFEATLFLLRIADNEVSRAAVIERLMNLSETPQQQYSLVSAIQLHDLLTYQNAHLLIAVMDQIARKNTDPRIHEIIRSLEPLTTPVTDDLTSNTLSERWQVEGAVAALDHGRLNILATPARSEFTLRLLRSERWRDSFIEAAVEESKGGFWLYARRSRNNLVRFGFDPGTERLHLQIWKGRNNDIVANRTIPWIFPAGGCTMRLEIRGKGVSALINGIPVFEVPLALPEDFGLGWTAIAAQSESRGKASVTLRSLSSGPLPVSIALTPPAPANDDQGRQTARLRARLGVLTDVSPDWFSVDSSGSWTSTVNEESDFYRLFARYYRLRLTPMVRASSHLVVTANDVVTICRTHEFDGLLLWFDAMPDVSWFDRMDRELNAPGLDVIAIAPGESGSTIIRGIASSRTLFKEYGAAVPLRVISEKEEQTEEAPDGVDIPTLFRY